MKRIIIAIIIIIVVLGLGYWLYQKENCRPENHECSVENTDIPCCNGLKEACWKVFDEEEGECTVCAPCGTMCLPCGDGICEGAENRCTCPEDCEEDEIADWQAYRNEEYGFEVDYPKAWVIREFETDELFPVILMVEFLSPEANIPEATIQNSEACGLGLTIAEQDIEQWLSEAEHYSTILDIETEIKLFETTKAQGHELIGKTEDITAYSVIFGTSNYIMLFEIPIPEEEISDECKEYRSKIIDTFRFLE